MKTNTTMIEIAENTKAIFINAIEKYENTPDMTMEEWRVTREESSDAAISCKEAIDLYTCDETIFENLMTLAKKVMSVSRDMELQIIMR